MLKCFEDAMTNSNDNRSNLIGTKAFDMLLFHSFCSFWYDFPYIGLENLECFSWQWHQKKINILYH